MRRLGSAAHAAASVRLPRPSSERFAEVETVGPRARRHMASPVGVGFAGDLGAQIGLGLESDLPGNLEKLRDFCSARRFLVLLEDPEGVHAGLFTFEGNCSTLIVAESGPTERPCAESLRAIQGEFAHPGGDWLELCRLARIGRRIARDQSRIAELYELLREWHALAEARGDRQVLDESAREMVWVLEGWGRFAEAAQLERRRVTEFSEQMTLPFDEAGETP